MGEWFLLLGFGFTLHHCVCVQRYVVRWCELWVFNMSSDDMAELICYCSPTHHTQYVFFCQQRMSEVLRAKHLMQKRLYFLLARCIRKGLNDNLLFSTHWLVLPHCFKLVGCFWAVAFWCSIYWNHSVGHFSSNERIVNASISFTYADDEFPQNRRQNQWYWRMADVYRMDARMHTLYFD